MCRAVRQAPARRLGAQASLIGAIMSADPPPMTMLQPMTPPVVERVVRSCLAKDPEDRWQTARDLRRELEWIRTEGDDGRRIPATQKSRLRPEFLWIGTAASLLVAGGFATIHLREAPPPTPAEMRLQIVTPATTATRQFALSPDGRYIVFVASGSGEQRLWLRPLNTTDAQPIAGNR